MGFVNFIKEYVWVPVVIGVLLLIIGIFVFCWLCRRYRSGTQYEYMPLRGSEVGLGRKMEYENQQMKTSGRTNAWVNSQFYLRGNPQYNNVQQLEDIGIRTNKHWFRVYDTRSRSTMIMSMMARPAGMCLAFSAGTQRAVRDLVQLLQHPYIYPLSDLDFMVDQDIVVVVYPVCARGSLKDYIYQSKSMDAWKSKYCNRNKGLSTTQIRCFGKQVLMALLFIEDKGYPPHGHVHSGNVMVENNRCRLLGCESSLLGEEPRIYNLLRKKLKSNKELIDVLCFGHLLFEMCAGFELYTAHPQPADLNHCRNPQVVQVLNIIFPEDKQAYPSLKQIAGLDFFADVPLPELFNYHFSQISLSREMKLAIRSVKRGKPVPTSTSRKQKLRRTQSSANTAESPVGGTTLRRSHSTANTAAINSTPPPSPATPIAPPPPPGPPTPGPFGAAPPPASSGRAALLGDIRSGAQLKQTETNDRSGPRL